jgi:hypothetical protein
MERVSWAETWTGVVYGAAETPSSMRSVMKKGYELE